MLSAAFASKSDDGSTLNGTYLASRKKIKTLFCQPVVNCNVFVDEGQNKDSHHLSAILPIHLKPIYLNQISFYWQDWSKYTLALSQQVGNEGRRN